TLQAHPSIAASVVLLRVEDGGEPTLVAYAVPKQGGYAASHAERPTPQTLRSWIAERLPEHMVPAAVVVLDALPLLPNGKVDRAALIATAPDGAPAEQFIEPRTKTEETIARIWRDVLKRDRIGVTES